MSAAAGQNVAELLRRLTGLDKDYHLTAVPLLVVIQPHLESSRNPSQHSIVSRPI